eukprot:gene51848-69393_t
MGCSQNTCQSSLNRQDVQGLRQPRAPALKHFPAQGRGLGGAGC